MDLQPTNLQLRDVISTQIFEECFQHLLEFMQQRINEQLMAKGGPNQH